MAASQLTAITVPSRSLPTFEGLRPSTVKIAAFVPLKQGLSKRSLHPLVVKAATVVAPKYTSIKPLADRVLVKIKEAEEKSSGGILLPTTAQTKPQAGEVVAIGEGRAVGKNTVEINVKPGTQVVYSKYAGTELEFNGTIHLLLKEDDIVGILETDDVKDLKPLNERVLIKVAEAEEKTAGGLLLTDASKEKPSFGTVIIPALTYQASISQNRPGKQVIAVGPGPLDEEGKRKPLSVSAGNTVLYSKYAGNEFKGKDGSNYIALRASDVMAVLS